MGPSKLVHDYEVTKKELNETQRVSEANLAKLSLSEKMNDEQTHEIKMLKYTVAIEGRLSKLEASMDNIAGKALPSISQDLSLLIASLKGKIHAPGACWTKRELRLYVSGFLVALGGAYGLIAKLLWK